MKSILAIDALTHFYLILKIRILNITQNSHATFHAHSQLLPEMLKSTPIPDLH